MNKEFNSNNYQDTPHHEGQQQNISHNRQDGENNPPAVERQEHSDERNRGANTNKSKGENSSKK